MNIDIINTKQMSEDEFVTCVKDLKEDNFHHTSELVMDHDMNQWDIKYCSLCIVTDTENVNNNVIICMNDGALQYVKNNYSNVTTKDYTSWYVYKRAKAVPSYEPRKMIR